MWTPLQSGEGKLVGIRGTPTAKEQAFLFPLGLSSPERHQVFPLGRSHLNEKSPLCTCPTSDG